MTISTFLSIPPTRHFIFFILGASQAESIISTMTFVAYFSLNLKQKKIHNVVKFYRLCLADYYSHYLSFNFMKSLKRHEFFFCFFVCFSGKKYQRQIENIKCAPLKLFAISFSIYIILLFNYCIYFQRKKLVLSLYHLC